MPSTMGISDKVKQDLLPLPVPRADVVLAATVVGVNHSGGCKSQTPGAKDATDLQRLAVNNLRISASTWDVDG